MVGKVCIIGAGPCGMNLLWYFAKKKREGEQVPEIVCFEKQGDVGGLWNYTWRTGLDEFGEPCQASMYRNLWSNGPKEALEFPHYTFEDHYKTPIPSFPPREVLFDYLKGMWSKEDVRPYIKFRHAVRDVEYDSAKDNFSVKVKDLVNNAVLEPEVFDYVVVATGHYSTPHVPHFEGIDKFPGRVLHSHDFRGSEEFAGKRLLLIGASYSAEDIALQCMKYGASSVICTWRTKPMGFNWPKGISERPLLQRLEGTTAVFKDYSIAEVDVVMYCTGYQHAYPFLREELRLKSQNKLYPPGLYKGMIWTNAGNNKLVYVGAQDQAYTYTMFDIEALWTVKYILGQLSIPDKSTMERDWRQWVANNDKIVDGKGVVDFQTKFVMDLANDCGEDYPYDINVAEMFNTWLDHKVECIATYRDHSFTSKFTGQKAPIHHTSFMKALDDSMETFMNKKQANGHSNGHNGITPNN